MTTRWLSRRATSYGPTLQSKPVSAALLLRTDLGEIDPISKVFYRGPVKPADAAANRQKFRCWCSRRSPGIRHQIEND
jgi:hypothetical protein